MRASAQRFASRREASPSFSTRDYETGKRLVREDANKKPFVRSAPSLASAL